LTSSRESRDPCSVPYRPAAAYGSRLRKRVCARLQRAMGRDDRLWSRTKARPCADPVKTSHIPGNGGPGGMTGGNRPYILSAGIYCCEPRTSPICHNSPTRQGCQKAVHSGPPCESRP